MKNFFNYFDKTSATCDQNIHHMANKIRRILLLISNSVDELSRVRNRTRNSSSIGRSFSLSSLEVNLAVSMQIDKVRFNCDLDQVSKRVSNSPDKHSGGNVNFISFEFIS